MRFNISFEKNIVQIPAEFFLNVHVKHFLHLFCMRERTIFQVHVICMCCNYPPAIDSRN
jgi:hypothetical protein